MTSQIDELLQKINEDGVRAAEKKARQIEETAVARAKSIVDKAKNEAESIIAHAKGEASKYQINAETALRQAARNLILEIRARIKAIFNRMLVSRIDAVLSGEELAGMLTAVMKSFIEKKGEGDCLQLLLNERDFGRLKEALFSDLKAELQKGLEVKPAGDIRSGFVVSYDQGASCYDFSDQALAEFISRSLSRELEAILTDSAKDSGGGINGR